MDRPTGIIRTLPSFEKSEIGFKRMTRSLAQLEAGHDLCIHIALDKKPLQDVLYMYLLVEGKIIVRLNIAGYTQGHTAKCWDGKYRQPNWWALCTGPVSRPPEPIPRRGFQGFRYTGDLW